MITGSKAEPSYVSPAFVYLRLFFIFSRTVVLFTKNFLKEFFHAKSELRVPNSIYRSSHQRYSIKIGVPKNSAKFTGKELCQSLFFNKFACLRPATLLKKRLWPRCFPQNFTKLLRTPFSQNTFERLLQNII